jgi:glutamate--cysteine ligase
VLLARPPQGRYALMKAYMPTVGSMGLDMMFRTCTVQVRATGCLSGQPTVVNAGLCQRDSQRCLVISLGQRVAAVLTPSVTVLPALVKVNLDFESEKDMVEKFRIGLALQPMANALFATSPFKEGKPSG